MKNLAVSFGLLAVLASCASNAMAQQPANLVPEASFEAPIPPWFSEDGGGGYFLSKEKVQGAADGKFVLSIQGWEKAGSKILSPAFALPDETMSGTLKLRSFGPAQETTLEFALFDEKGETKLASFGTVKLDGAGTWSTLSGARVKLAQPPVRGRAALIITGPQRGVKVEIDQAGLFGGEVVFPVVDNADFTSFEAEEMADGKSWTVMPHFTGWYSGMPSGGKMLAGNTGIAPADLKPATKTVTVGQPGLHRLWARLFRTDPSNKATYIFSIEQGGKTVASRDIDDSDAKIGPNETWVWVPLDAELAAGPAQITVTRPPGESSWIARKIDMFVLTSMTSYEPKVQDFAPRGYVRFTNRSENQDPFCLMLMVNHVQGPVYYATPGMLSLGGLSKGYFVPNYYDPTNKDKWLGPGDSSPWVRISDFLEPYGNRMQVYATRATHTEGYVAGNWKGTLEFSTGDDHRIVKTIAIDQSAPRFLMTLGDDFNSKPEEIRTAWDYARHTEEVIAKAGTPYGSTPRHLDLNVILIGMGVDDPKLIETEINNIKKMGFNGTYTPLVEPGEAVAFNTAHGLQQHFGMWAEGFAVIKNNCYNQPDIEGLNNVFKQQAERYAPIVNKVERMKLCDEPGAQPYQHYAECAFCKEKFKSELKEHGFTPQQLGVASWDEVQPVMPQDKDKHPELFYYTGLFRLQSFANLARTAVGIKNKYLPANVKTYVCYSPPFAESLTWDQRGNDLFMCHRDGGFEMGWSEDWLGYGSGPQTMSPLYSQMRSAGSPTNMPIGGYMVAASGSPTVLRLKYYQLVAAGARNINVYNYGPYYASVDSFSTNDGQYAPLIRAQHEFGVIDEALYGAKRRPTDIAIYYNRTAGIWLNNLSTTDQDSRFIHFALAHAGYDADFVCDEDIAAGKLAKYKVLYFNGVQVPPATATQVAAWVKNGGVLAATAGAGTCDQYNRPIDILDAVYGASSQNYKQEQDAGRPKYELRTLPILDELTTVPDSGAPQVAFNQLCIRESLTPAPDAKVILKNKAGEPMGVVHAYGKGQAIRLAVVPGVIYLNEAMRDKNYDPDTNVPHGFRPELRDFIVWPAMLAKAYRTAHANMPATEITRYDGKNGTKARAIVFAVDYTAEKNPNFSMTLPQAAQFTKAYSATGTPVTLKRTGTDSLQVSFTLDSADAIVLE